MTRVCGGSTGSTDAEHPLTVRPVPRRARSDVGEDRVRSGGHVVRSIGRVGGRRAAGPNGSAGRTSGPNHLICERVRGRSTTSVAGTAEAFGTRE
jgi:hypothetical protein